MNASVLSRLIGAAIIGGLVALLIPHSGSLLLAFCLLFLAPLMIAVLFSFPDLSQRFYLPSGISAVLTISIAIGVHLLPNADEVGVWEAFMSGFVVSSVLGVTALIVGRLIIDWRQRRA